VAVWNQNYTFVAGQVPTAANWNANPSSLSTLLSGQVDRDNVDSTSADGIGVLNVNQTWTGNQTHTGTTQLSNTLTVGVDGTGYDVQLFGATSGAYMLWDESTDDLVLAGAAQLYLNDAGGGEHLSSDGTDLTINSGRNINLTCASGDVVIPANIGLTFGDAAEKIEGDGTDLTISGNNIKLTAVADVVVPANVGITFGDAAEKIEGNGTDLTVASSGDLNLTATGDVNIPADVGVTFGNDAEKIEGDGTDLTISGNNINLTATADVVVPANVGITFGSGEKIEGDDTDLTVTSGGDINLSTGTGALSITAGDMTLYDDNNNADVTMKMGTGSAEALEIAVLNGGSNKTAEEVRFTSKTASGTGDHGKIAFYVDDAEIGTFDDGGLDLASGKAFSVAGSALSSGTALTGSTDNWITTVTGADAIQGEANLTFDGSVLITGGGSLNNDQTQGVQIDQNTNDNFALTFESSDVGHGFGDLADPTIFGAVGKAQADAGGLQITGVRDPNSVASGALHLRGFIAEAAATDDTTGSQGVVDIEGNVTDGGASWQGAGSTGNILTIANGSTTRVVFKGDGTVHASDTSWADSLDDLPDAISGRSLTTQRAVESGGVLAGYQIHAPELVDALEARGIVTAAEKPGEGEIPGHRFLNLQKGVKFSWDMAFQNFCWLAHLIERHVPADEIKNFPMASELQSGLRYLEKGRNNGSHL